MVTTNAFLGHLLVSLSVGVITLAGCLDGESSSSHTCQIDVRNQSTNDIRLVTVISECTTNEFGFLASQGTGATSLFCQFEFSRRTSVQWTETGQKLNATNDTVKYTSQQKILKSLSFIYQGNGKWKLIARSGTNEDSPEVKP